MQGLGAQLQERDLGKNPLSERELQTLIGDDAIEAFLNTRSALYRERGFKATPPTKAQAIKLMAQEPNLIKRPITVRGHRKVIGFDESKLRALVAEEVGS